MTREDTREKAPVRGIFRSAVRRLLRCLVLLPLLCCFAASAAPASRTAAPPVPKGLEKLASAKGPEEIAEAFLGIPYREDGAVNDRGQYTLFAERARLFSTPGLNCSGLVLEMSRFLLGRNISLDEAVRDRLGDSAPGSPHGEDWDFGWDLIMNISEGLPRFLLLPGGKRLDPAGTTGHAPRGYDIQAEATWKELPARLKTGYLYLVSLNVESRRKGYGLQHYHVGVILVTRKGQAWFYQTTGKGVVSNRRDLKSAGGWAAFTKAFANTGKKRKMMLVLETPLPEAR